MFVAAAWGTGLAGAGLAWNSEKKSTLMTMMTIY